MATKTKLSKNALVIAEDDSKEEVRLDYNTLRRAVLTLRAVNHPLRKQIITLLETQKKMPVTEIYENLKLEQSVASQHLAILRRAEIVKTEREGKYIYYSVNKRRIGQINEIIQSLAQMD
ncbi:MAG: metalloregulator ArsR/SmtB family transcription factor [Bacteroidota bacterium]